jgi:hypothetical protein
MSEKELPVILSGVPYTMIETVWSKIEHFLEDSIQHSDNKYTASSLKQALVARDMQLWIALQGVNILSYAITYIVDYPTQRRLCIILMGGEHLDKWKHLIEDMSQWAKQQQCVAIEAFARPGWERVWAKWGIKKVHTVFKLDL